MRPAVHEAEVAFHPQAQTQPIAVRDAWAGVPEDGTSSRVGAHTKIWQAMRAVGPGQTQPGHHSHVRLRADRPAPTIQQAGGLGHYHLWHPAEHRVISVAECKRCTSFPDAFVFSGSVSDAWTRIGNSVPPRLTQAVAEHVAMTFLGAPSAEPARPLDFIDKPINPPGPYLFNVVSLFAGCGGSSLGYKWAGGKVLAAVEWDHNAAETYRLNHHGTPVLERDIKTVTPEELLALTGLQPGELDILDGSPPCQGFSTAGKRNFYDDRNDLFAEYVRLLRGVQPKVFVMENVSGMVKGHMKHIFARIMRELKASGYTVKAQLMNAMYFGVPQSRERVIIIGVREDVPASPSHPAAQSEPPGIPLAPLTREPEQRIGAHDVATARAHKKRHEALGHGFGYTVLSGDKPAPTLPHTLMRSTSAPRFVDHEAHWLPSRVELNRIGSFPDTFRCAGSYANHWERIGNTVPPRFMQAIAEHVRDHVLAPVAAPGPAGQAPGAR